MKNMSSAEKKKYLITMMNLAQPIISSRFFKPKETPKTKEKKAKSMAAMPAMIECLQSMQDEGNFAVPVDFFYMKKTDERLTKLIEIYPNLKILHENSQMIIDIANYNHTDTLRPVQFVDINLNENVEKFMLHAEQYKSSQIQQCNLNVNANKFDVDKIPKASELFPGEKKPTIVLNVNNFHDGIGDVQTLLTIARKTQEVLEKKGYRVVGLLTLMEGGGKAQHIRAHVKKALEEHNPFDKLYINDYNPMNKKISFQGLENKIMVTGEKRPIYEGSRYNSTECEDEATKDISENAVAYINILYENVNPTPGAAGNHANYSTHISPSSLILDVGECAQIPKTSFIQRPNHYLSSNLGLPAKDQEYSVHGLLLQPQITTREELADKFKKFININYIKTLISNEDINEETIKQYQNNHSHMIGYLQTPNAGNLYILSNILRHYDKETNKLSKSCDFHLNSAAIDEGFLKDAFKGLQLSNFKFIKADMLDDELLDINSSPTIRIFSGIRLDQDDYQALYSLSNEPAGCSGDNSFADAGQRRLPFPGILSKENQFAKDFVQKQLDQFLSDKFPALQDFCKAVAKESLIDLSKDDLKPCYDIAEKLNSDTLWKEWEEFSKDVESNYNYFDGFPGILNEILVKVAENKQHFNQMTECLTSTIVSDQLTPPTISKFRGK